jgi:hypothetical protein
MKFIPRELVDMIADYHDYEKYYKPEHKILLNNILDDIKNMSEIMPDTINPTIAWQCWGAGAKHLTYDDNEYDAYMDHHNMAVEVGGTTNNNNT